MADYTFKAGSVDVPLYFTFNQVHASPSNAYYVRELGSLVTLTPGTQHAADNSAHVDNKWRLVAQDVGAQGLSIIRYDFPDAAFAYAAGVRSLRAFLIGNNGSGFAELKIDLVNYDPATLGVFSVDNKRVVPSRVAKLGTRFDDITIAWPELVLRPNEGLPVWIDCSAICGDEWLASAANAVSSNTGNFTIATTGAGAQMIGVNREFVVLWLNPVGAAGSTASITMDVTPNAGETLKVKLNVKVATD